MVRSFGIIFSSWNKNSNILMNASASNITISIKGLSGDNTIFKTININSHKNIIKNYYLKFNPKEKYIMETFQESFNAVFNTINEISANRKTLTDNVKALRRDMKVLYKSSAKKPTERKSSPRWTFSRSWEVLECLAGAPRWLRLRWWKVYLNTLRPRSSDWVKQAKVFPGHQNV